MARNVKVIKDKEGNDVEVYSDICKECSIEMIFPKKEADELESVFPFMKKKLEEGTSCLDCTKKKVEAGDIASILSTDELNEIKNFMMKNIKIKK